MRIRCVPSYTKSHEDARCACCAAVSSSLHRNTSTESILPPQYLWVSAITRAALAGGAAAGFFVNGAHDAKQRAAREFATAVDNPTLASAFRSPQSESCGPRDPERVRAARRGDSCLQLRLLMTRGQGLAELTTAFSNGTQWGTLCVVIGQPLPAANTQQRLAHPGVARQRRWRGSMATASLYGKTKMSRTAMIEFAEEAMRAIRHIGQGISGLRGTFLALLGASFLIAACQTTGTGSVPSGSGGSSKTSGAGAPPRRPARGDRPPPRPRRRVVDVDVGRNGWNDRRGRQWRRDQHAAKCDGRNGRGRQQRRCRCQRRVR